jgi:hypothetical protein
VHAVELLQPFENPYSVPLQHLLVMTMIHLCRPAALLRLVGQLAKWQYPLKIYEDPQALQVIIAYILKML